MKLYVKEIEDGSYEKPMSVRDFLIWYFSGNNTFMSSSKATYKTNKCLRKQCAENKIRSFDDLLALVTTYFPSYNEIKLIKILLTLKVDGKIFLYDNTKKYVFKNIKLKPQLGYCSTMNKIRYILSNNSNLYFDNIVYAPKGSSKYSWLELLNMIGINNQDQLNNFIKKY